MYFFSFGEDDACSRCLDDFHSLCNEFSFDMQLFHSICQVNTSFIKMFIIDPQGPVGVFKFFA